MKQIIVPQLLIIFVFGLTTLQSLASTPAVPSSDSSSLSSRTVKTSNLAASKPTSYKQAMERLDVFMEMIGELHSLVDRSTFDLEALLEKLDYDAEKIIAFVQNNITYEQYPGLLRSTKATLTGRAGNTLDQSLLLLTLLKDAGYEARIVHSVLTSKTSKLLLEQMRPLSNSENSLDQEAIGGILKDYSTRLGIDTNFVDELIMEIQSSPPIEQTSTYKNTKRITKTLVESLSKSGFKLNDSSTQKTLIDEASQYYWVQYRLSSSRSWLDAHPTLFLNDEIKQLEPQNIYTKNIPEKLQHRFSFQVFVEQDIRGKRKQISLSEPWERSTANMSGQTFSFNIVPSSMLSPENLKNIESTTNADSDIFFALFNGKPLENAFDIRGNVIPLDAAASNYAALFATASDKLNNAAGLLDQIGSTNVLDTSKRIASLVSVKILYTLIAPGGEKTEYIRTVYDKDTLENQGNKKSRSGGSKFISKNLYSNITRLFSFSLAAGNQSESETIRKTLEGVINSKRTFEVRIAQQYTPNEKVQEVLAANTWKKHTQLYGIFDSDTFSQETYRSAPNLVVHHETLGLYSNYKESIDVVQNIRRSKVSGNSARRLLQQGVWESLTEGSLLSGGGTNTTGKSNYKIIQTAKELESIRSQLSTVGYENARNDIQKGYVLAMVGSENGEPSSLNSWWRIRKTGEALRIRESGEGAESTAYITKQQVLKAAACVSVAVNGCTTMAAMMKATAFLNVMSKNAELIDKFIELAAAVGITGLSPDVSPGPVAQGASAMATVSLQKVSEAFIKRCMKQQVPKCFR